MAKRRFVIELDPSDLFDKLVGNKDLQRALGERMVGMLLTPPGFMDAVGIAFYGITATEEPETQPATADLQRRVRTWMTEAFGAVIPWDRTERNFRFVEEALELAQANGATADECSQLVAYVFGRAVGEVHQEVGGVMVTLAALCNTLDLDVNAEFERELTRIEQPDVMAKIRAKQAAKPDGVRAALPGYMP